MGGALMKLLSDLYTMSLVFFALLYVETLTLIRSITGLNPKPADKLIMSAAEYFTLMDERSPPEVFYAAASGSQPECRVCLSELEEGDEIGRLRCGHVYHMVCLDTWLQGCGATCPLCRARVLPDHAAVAIRRPPEEVDFDGSDEEELILFLSAAIQGGSVFHSLYF